MRVAALQYDVSRDSDRNWSFVESQLELAAERGVDLVLLPEMWASGFPAAGDDPQQLAAADRVRVEALREKSQALGLCVAGSSLHAHGERILNRLELFESGESRFYYDKVHLFTPTAEHEVFSAGELAPTVGEARGCRISGGICYDLRFPELFRMPFRDGVQLLLLPAQWPVPRAAHWTALAIARAVENQCFVLACNRTGEALIGRRGARLEFPGNSLLITPYGEVLASGEGQSGLVTGELDLDLARHFRVRVPVAKDDRADLYERWYKK